MYADRGAGTNRRGKIESKEGICNTVIPTTKLQKKKKGGNKACKEESWAFEDGALLRKVTRKFKYPV